MASTLKVDNIIATDGTTAPITLSGDAATLGSAVTFPAGHVIQCVHVLSNDRTSFSVPNNNVGVHIDDVDLAITLKSSNSKIVCSWVLTCETAENNVFNVYKDGSLATNGKNTNAGNAYSGFAVAVYDQDVDSTPEQVTIQYVDPNPTSGTYQVRVGNSGNSTNTFYLNRSEATQGNTGYENGVSSAIICEIMK